MKVKALNDGTIGRGNAVRRVRKGEVFDLPEGVKMGKWMAPVADEAPTAPEAKGGKSKAKAKGEPSTFSEVTAQEAKALAPKGAEDLV